MKLVFVIVCLCVSIETGYGRLSRDEMRKALGGNPMFSHSRGSAVPLGQNVNIALPVSDPAVQPPRGRPSANNRPTMLGSRIGGTGIPVKQKKPARAVPAMRPVREQEMVLGQKRPTKISQPQPAVVPSRPGVRRQPNIAASKPSRNVRPSTSVASTQQQAVDSKRECSFHIPSFLLPDPNPGTIGSSLKCPSFLLPGPNINPELVNLMVEHWTGIKNAASTPLNGVKSQITQVEFEQKCLIPALRGYVLGGAECKSRELKVYLEWLLYLRRKLFNI